MQPEPTTDGLVLALIMLALFAIVTWRALFGLPPEKRDPLGEEESPDWWDR